MNHNKSPEPPNGSIGRPAWQSINDSVIFPSWLIVRSELIGRPINQSAEHAFRVVVFALYDLLYRIVYLAAISTDSSTDRQPSPPVQPSANRSCKFVAEYVLYTAEDDYFGCGYWKF